MSYLKIIIKTSDTDKLPPLFYSRSIFICFDLFLLYLMYETNSYLHVETLFPQQHLWKRLHFTCYWCVVYSVGFWISAQFLCAVCMLYSVCMAAILQNYLEWEKQCFNFVLLDKICRRCVTPFVSSLLWAF